MTRDETKQILMRIQSTYPNWKPQGDLGFVIDTWNEYFEGIQYQEVLNALRAYVATERNGFAPSPGQLIGIMDIRNQGSDLNEMEAWALVSSALRNGTYGAEQEFANLPELVQKAVGSPSNLRNWSQTDIESVENVIQSNFMRSYRTVLKREQELRRMPENVRTLLIGKSESIGISEKN